MIPPISMRQRWAQASLLTFAINLDHSCKASDETEAIWATSLANIQYSEVRNTGFASEPQSRRHTGEEQFLERWEEENKQTVPFHSLTLSTQNRNFLVQTELMTLVWDWFQRWKWSEISLSTNTSHAFTSEYGFSDYRINEVAIVPTRINAHSESKGHRHIQSLVFLFIPSVAFPIFAFAVCTPTHTRDP